MVHYTHLSLSCVKKCLLFKGVFCNSTRVNLEKMIELCRVHGLEPPSFHATASHVGVIFPVTLKQTEVIPDDLSTRQREIARLIRQNGKMQLKEIREHLPNEVKRTTQADLAQLRKKQVVYSQGRGPSSYWFYGIAQNLANIRRTPVKRVDLLGQCEPFFP